VEHRLVEIWQDVLGMESIGVTDNFFELGVHSLLAVRLFVEIEKRFGRSLPLASIFKAPTIERLASILDPTTPSNGSSPLVAIQPQGSKPPFFCVHELFGDVLCYMNLARHLGEDQPFYALQARGLDGVEEPFSDIQTMAAHYIEAIQTVQPEGPYALGGLCFGGIVAFEMAQQLRAKGEAANLVALLDSGVNSKQGSVARWWSFLRNLPRDLPSWLIGSSQLNRSQWLDLIRLKIRRAKARLAVNFQSAPELSETYSSKLIKEMGDLFQFSKQHRKVARAQYQALRQYKPRVYPDRLTLFRPRMQPLFSSHRPDKGWGRLAAGGIEIRVVPGNHLGMLQEPHVKILAKELRACLDNRIEVDASSKTPM
jgi:thioesterase domain-containing protein/acyl carrier protein